jgi:hypothetical protein
LCDCIKLYHSIHARGENVEEVLRKAEAAELAGQSYDETSYEPELMDTETAKTGAPMMTAQDESAEITDNTTQQPRQPDKEPQVSQIFLCFSLFEIESPLTMSQTATSRPENADNANTSGAIPFTAPGGMANMPNVMLGEGETLSTGLLVETRSTKRKLADKLCGAKVQDQGLKNIMMAWYFAGYYTGLYEGQRRATQNIDPRSNA